MSWKQSLVNAQVSINRAVCEMNKKGLNPNWKEKGIKTDPDIEYIEREVTEAIKDLNKVILTINDVIDNKAD